MRDPYDVLGVPRDADADAIRSAFRKLARQYHPDVNPGNAEAEERFKEINAAYGVLSDPEKRARFDRTGSVEDIPAGADYMEGGIQDLFDAFFGGFDSRRGGRRRNVRAGDDVRADVELTLFEVVTGATKTINYRRQARCRSCSGTGAEGGAQPERCPKCGGQGVVTQTRNTFIGSVRTQTTCSNCGGMGTVVKNPCQTCRGVGLTVEDATVEVPIPPGVEDGLTVHIQGRGSDGLGGGPTGDLYVVLNVQEDPRFQRQGRDLVGQLMLTFAQATLGDNLEIEGLDATYDLTIPAGTSPGTYLRVPEAGLPPLHGGRRGDLVLQTTISVPRDLSEAQKEAVRNLAKALDENAPQEGGGGLLGGLFKRKKP